MHEPDQPLHSVHTAYIVTRELGSVVGGKAEECKYIFVDASRVLREIIVQDQLRLVPWEYPAQFFELGLGRGEVDRLASARARSCEPRHDAATLLALGPARARGHELSAARGENRMTNPKPLDQMTREELKQEWIYWHAKDGKARRLTNAADPESGEIVRNIEAVDAEMERRQLDFNE